MDSDTAVYREYAAEGVLLLGGGAAILLQLADPRVAAGVARHSDVENRALDRLVGTIEYLYAVGFGDADDLAAVVRSVDRAHAGVRGPAGPRHPAYSATEPDAQRFVASTIAAIGLDLDRRLQPVRPAGRDDAIVRGSASLASSLQGGEAGWPASATEFDAWWRHRIEGLEVGDDARSVARLLLSGRPLPAVLRPLMPVARLVTAALLPAAVRDAYGFRWTGRSAAVAGTWLRLALGVWPRLPRAIRHAPMRLVLRRVRRRASRYAETEPRGRG